jgi:hypothetical protein
MAALESEMTQLTVKAESITALAQASDARAAVASLFEMIRSLVTRHPQLVRMIRFSALEIGEGLAPLCKKHLAPVLDISASYLKRWIDSGDLHVSDPRLMVLACLATFVGVDSFYPLIWGAAAGVRGDAQMGDCAELWNAVLTTDSAN